ncbi:MAG: ABC transporter ATP-binding protein [Pseudomonadota bacterium]
MSEPLLRIQDLTKSYPGVLANNAVSFDIGKSELHALLGENGAGKSTLVKMIYGLVKPDSGSMQLNGTLFHPTEPRSARADGIAMVFQHFSLFDALTVAENIALGMEDPPPMRTLAQHIEDVSQNYGLPLGAERIVGDLSAGERQRVELIRCLLQGPKLLIMDEPTSVLTPQEVEILFETLRKLRDNGTSILYISHKLDEIKALCDTATILRRGEKVGVCNPSETSTRDMAEMMVGSTLKSPSRGARELGDPALEMINVTTRSSVAFGSGLINISISVRKGEIMGIGGVAGNGQDDLLLALSGEVTTEPSSIRLSGLPVGHLAPNARRELGLLAAPEERLGHAAAPDMSLTENAMLSGFVREKLLSNGFVNWKKSSDFAERIVEQFDVRTPGVDNAASSLSGGNLQKFVIGREVLQNPDVLVVNQPTWGVDAAAAASIRQAILDLASNGCAVIWISQDLDELMEVSDRFAALNGGRLSEPQPTQDLSVDEIGLMMGGVHGDA